MISSIPLTGSAGRTLTGSGGHVISISGMPTWGSNRVKTKIWKYGKAVQQRTFRIKLVFCIGAGVLKFFRISPILAIDDYPRDFLNIFKSYKSVSSCGKVSLFNGKLPVPAGQVRDISLMPRWDPYFQMH
jgi:hypothetical protein